MPAVDQYVQRARARLLEVLAEEHAVVHPELESRVSEAGYQQSDLNVDPHHVTTALRSLIVEQVVRPEKGVTRGGRSVETFRLEDGGRNETKIAAAIGRKRLLLARYQGWSQGSKRNPRGLVGPAGERATRRAIVESSALQPIVPGAGEVASVLGTTLPGPADSGGYFVPVISEIPQPPITMLFEVKNIRSWIYPSSSEVFQLLDKVVLLQRMHPDVPIVGTLVCRKAHNTLFWMAKQLGFLVIELGAQFAGEVSGPELDEVRNELHFTDLRVGSGPSLRVRDRLRSDGLQSFIPTIADSLRATALDDRQAQLVSGARKAGNSTKRLRIVDALRLEAKRVGHRGGW